MFRYLLTYRYTATDGCHVAFIDFTSDTEVTTLEDLTPVAEGLALIGYDNVRMTAFKPHPATPMGQA